MPLNFKVCFASNKFELSQTKMCYIPISTSVNDSWSRNLSIQLITFNSLNLYTKDLFNYGILCQYISTIVRLH